MAVRSTTHFAAIDLGSNSFRLEIGRAERGSFTRVDYLKETVRLGAGLDANNQLSASAITRGVDCLARFGERLRGFAPDRVRAVATATLRFAENRDAFLTPAIAALGYPIEVISGREEARLIYQGVAHLLPDSDELRLVVDIGGGSTELIIGEGFRSHAAESFKLGCVSHTRRFFADGRLQQANLAAAEIAATAELEEARAQFGAGATRSNWQVAYGSSGTIGALADLARLWGEPTGAITRDTLDEIRRAFIAAGDVAALKLPGMKPDRLPVVAGGYAVLRGVFDALDIESMRPAKGALRHGVLYDLLGRCEHIDARDATVEHLIQRFCIDRVQAEAVAANAGRLFRALLGKDISRHRDAERMLLRAGIVHEIGFYISHGDYHKHGAYILANGDLPGFSTNDQTALAALVLAQRGNLKKLGDRLVDPVVRHQVFALRIAVLLAHGRDALEAKHIAVVASRNGYSLKTRGSWLKSHPLTRHLLAEEVEQWKRAGYRVTLDSDGV